MNKDKFEYYSKQTESNIINGKLSIRTSIIEINTDSKGEIYGKIIIKIKDPQDTKEHYKEYKLSKKQIDEIRKNKITPAFEELSHSSFVIPRTATKKVKVKRPKSTRKNRRNLTRRG